MSDPVPGEPVRNATFAQTMKAVAWSFFGVRKRSDYERDAAQLNPVHVIVAALIGVLVFVGRPDPDREERRKMTCLLKRIAESIGWRVR